MILKKNRTDFGYGYWLNVIQDSQRLFLSRELTYFFYLNGENGVFVGKSKPIKTDLGQVNGLIPGSVLLSYPNQSNYGIHTAEPHFEHLKRLNEYRLPRTDRETQFLKSNTVECFLETLSFMNNYCAPAKINKTNIA